jgi:YVTN family beta-propeller protein
MKFLAIALLFFVAFQSAPVPAAELPGPTESGYRLPNGWQITPVGTAVPVHDLVTNLLPTPDGKFMLALSSGYNPHELVLINIASGERSQVISLPTSFMGLAWSPDGATLYVSGGNNKSKEGVRAPVYAFAYDGTRLSDKPVRELAESVAPDDIYWSGLAHHPSQPVLYAANRTAGNIVVFDTAKGEIITRIPTGVNPYDLVLSPDGARLYCSNWASDSVSVIDTASNSIVATIEVGDNPNDMILAKDGRLFVCCANDNTVVVIDTARGRAVGAIVTSLHERAPEGSTPNALALDPESETLYIANADNNNVCVVDIEDAAESAVLGFLPAGWYPSALGMSPDGATLYIGNAKGLASSANIRGPHSPLPEGEEGKGTTKSTMKGSVNIVSVADYKSRLRELTKQAYANCPYNDDQLAKAKPRGAEPSVIPETVGVGSAIKHVVYIIKENRTYDQVLGDLPQGNGDPRLAIFGREITPNHHALAEQFVLLDNLYCDAEVSVDGHQWSNAAYATDFAEKLWPASYGGLGGAPMTDASIPASGYMWDLCKRKGLTYRSYGEFAHRVSEGEAMSSRAQGLAGHVAPNYLNWGARDTENAAEFIKEFDVYEANFDNPDPEKRLPNYIVMGLPEDHTVGSSPGKPTIQAAVGSNDYALGLIIERLSHSKYWPDMAIFVIEDDAQDGPDHVDARRTIGFAISPYVRRQTVDSTFYTTSSMLRTMQLLLGLPPMSQFDASANPMYRSFSDVADLTPYTHLEPTTDINALNEKTAWGAKESMEMDFSEFDRMPMAQFNEIIWKNAKGPNSEMPLPVHRFVAASLAEE